MSDVVVTVPIGFRYGIGPERGLDAWCKEGDAAGEPDSGQLWTFFTSGGRPKITPGEQVYVVCEDRLRGFAPLVDLNYESGSVYLIRGGGAVAITIPEMITGFRGWRYRWWPRADEVPFPDWRTTDRRHRQQRLF